MVSNVNEREEREFVCCSVYSMCYSFYKIGKKKRLSGGPQEQVDNQYDSQPNEMSCSNPITVNASYTKQAAAAAVTAPASHTGSQDTVYEDIQPRDQ